MAPNELGLQLFETDGETVIKDGLILCPFTCKWLALQAADAFERVLNARIHQSHLSIRMESPAILKNKILQVIEYSMSVDFLNRFFGQWFADPVFEI